MTEVLGGQVAGKASISDFAEREQPPSAPPARRNEQTAADYEKWFFGRLRAVEAALADREWLCGGRFTIADIAIAYALYLGDAIVGLGDGFGPNVRAYLDRVWTRPGFVRAMEVDARAPAWR